MALDTSGRLTLTRRALLTGLAGGMVALKSGNALAATPRLIHTDYIDARVHFRTRLVKKGPAPDAYQTLEEPSNARQITYASDFGGKLDLIAWVSRYTPSARAKPAVLFLHGGNAMGHGHWAAMTPYIDGGYVVMMPSMRGENGQKGAFSGFYDEVEDVLAAAEALRHMPGIDGTRLFIAGHSIGGTLAMLASMSSHRFRAAVPISGNPDSFRFFARYPQDIRFEKDNVHEYEVRSALCYAGSFKCPVHVLHGTEERHFNDRNALLAKRARGAGVRIAQSILPGNHTTVIPHAVHDSIRFFDGIAA